MYSAMVVEDELLVRIGIKVSISGSGLPVRVSADVADGLEAYELFLRDPPDILITDLRLPAMCGLELIQRVREGGYSGCKILIISCLEDFQTLRDAMSSQISGYLLKATMTAQELTGALDKIIRELDSGKSRPPLTEPDGVPAPPGSSVSWEWLEDRLGKPAKSVGVFTAAPSRISGIAMATLEALLHDKLPGTAAFACGGDLAAVSGESLDDADFRDSIKALVRSARTSTGIGLFCGWKSAGPGSGPLMEALRAAAGLAVRSRELELGYFAFESAAEASPALVREKPKIRPEIRRVLDYMNAHLGDSLHLQEMADMAGLSGNYFSNLFTQECGISFVAYLTHVRLEKAKELLLDGSLSIQEIASSCGFHDESYFSRSFKSKYAASPGKWRRKNIKR